MRRARSLRAADSALSRLRASGWRPSRRLGQHFLHDPELLRSLVAAAVVGPGDAAFEVGTGTGALTRHLAAAARKVLSVEVDGCLAELARRELRDLENVEILQGDVLSCGALSPGVRGRLEALGPFRWVSNLPYSVASPLLLALLETRLPWRCAVVTVQDEVARRLCARRGTKAYGPLTVLSSFWARSELLRRIPPGAFQPPPKVWSAAVRLTPRAAEEGTRTPAAYEAYRCWVRRLFRARRKQIGRLLRDALGEAGAREVLEAGGWAPDLRPDDLSPEDFLLLASRCPVG